ncbi:MAG: dTMP kinase [Steroidobacteraceae bacterium]
MRGRFITFEGIEGVGKSTQVQLAAEHLRARGIDPIRTREPGGTPLAEKLRALVLDPQHAPVGAAAELLMLFAARASHVETVIRPGLERGRWILCDRFTDTTEAYQGGGRGMNADWIRRLAQIAHPRLMPDLTLLFDAPAAMALARQRDRGAGRDRIEAEDEAFFERARQAYLAIAAREPARLKIIDATASEAAVAGAVANAIDAAFPLTGS